MYTALIVDDNKVIRLMLVEMLKKIDGIAIAGECDTAISARTFLKNEKIDILFLDVEMPGMTGLELLKVLTERPATIGRNCVFNCLTVDSGFSLSVLWGRTD